ncbi:MAG: MFS transporter [Polynucleobacter sp. 17-46-58]|jgi:PPP family 3-phenylpropionic acid transporter|nr:MAG: MFS transporter [Polynucleobacter sp. 16-46-70]OZA41590.1 MAG: MFS transporter [Polynucleobacter sp. 17-46-58]HQR83835.1 MFS transporter [Polynucleobacter sp.]HQS61151.1 MFS transporter [Polynucleobacter sp.]HQT21214.1 MFS transporter [Polynucleobacter sp.]
MTPSVRWAFGSFFFLYFAYVGLVSPFASLFFLDRGFSVIEIAVLMSMLQITRIVGPFSWGWLSDYLSNRIGIIRFCACLAAFVFLCIFFLKSYMAFFVWMFVLHTILSSLMPLGESATVHALFKDNSFDKRYGRLRLWGSIGFIAMVLFAGELFQSKGIELYPIVGSTVLIFLAVVTFKLHEPKMERRKMVKGELLVVLFNPDVRWFLISGFFMIFAHAALYVFYSLYLADLGYNKFQIGLFWALGVFAEVIFFYFQSKVLSRLDPEVVLQMAFGIGVIRFALIAFFPLTWVLILAQIMHAGTFAAHHSAATKLLQRWFTGPLQARGQALMATVSYGLGGTLGGIVAGWLWDATLPRNVFVMSALACGLAGMAIGKLRPRHQSA